MVRQQVEAIRSRAADPTLKWNILVAQQDRDYLLGAVEGLLDRVAELEKQVKVSSPVDAPKTGE